MYKGALPDVNVTIEERTVVLSGFRAELSTHYLVAGEGPPLVLLHGVGDSADTWRHVIPALARTHRVYAPSFPGSGRSAKPSIDYSPALLSVFLQRFLDTLAIERPVIVGNSMGGLVAARFALSAPTGVTGLCLVDSAGLGRQLTLAMRVMNLPGMGKLVTSWNKTPIGASQWALQMAGLLFKRPTRVPPEWLAGIQEMAQTDGYLEATVALIRSASNLRGQLKRELVLDELPRLTVPIQIIWGEGDRVVRARQAQRAVERLRQGQVAIIPDCGHLPQVECPDQFVDILSQFLAHVPALHETAPARDAALQS